MARPLDTALDPQGGDPPQRRPRRPPGILREHWLSGARRAAAAKLRGDREPSSGLRRRGMLSRTIQGRLAIIFALLLLPPTALSLWQAWDSFEDHKVRARLQVRQFAIMTATHEGKFFEETRGALRRLASDDAIRSAGTDCAAVLTAAIDRTPQFAQLALYDPAGMPLCGNVEGLKPAGDRDWHSDAQTPGAFAISDYTVTPDTGYPAIVAAQAVYDRDGALTGVLAATIRLYWLAEFVRDIGLPPGSVFFLVDDNGNVLAGRVVQAGRGAASGAPSGAPGGRADEAADPGQDRDALLAIAGADVSRIIAGRSLADFETEGQDGIRRVFSAVALPHGGVTALFGMPATTMLGWLEEDVTKQILTIAAMWVSGIVAAWLGARYLVTRWIGTLRGMAHAFGRGEYAASASLRRAPEELADLGDTLRLMARRIEDREADLRATVAQKDILLREIHHRVKNNLQIVSSLLNIRGDRVASAAGIAAIDEVKNQVRALALVHRYLYETGDVREIDLRAFMTELCESTLAALAQPAQPVDLALDIPPFPVATDRAIPIALLTVEAITNALKHAFPAGRRGRISVGFAPTGPGTGTLTIADDGTGMPEAQRSGTAAPGIGLTLIRAFAQQVGASVTITGPPQVSGTVISVEIPAGGEPATARETTSAAA